MRKKPLAAFFTEEFKITGIQELFQFYSKIQTLSKTLLGRFGLIQGLLLLIEQP